jgi:gamma-glutamylcyclotransferase (GGCT)/AIG2-like uncharacterized protein YtfP
MKNLYFAYGSNMGVEQMKKRCPDSLLIGKGFITNHKLCFPQIAVTRGLLGVAGIREGIETDEVHGLIYELTDKDLELLHTFEGYDKDSISNSSYFPKQVKFHLHDNVSNTYTLQDSQVIIYQSNFDNGDDFYVSSDYLLLMIKPMIKYGLDSDYILKIIEKAKANPKPSLRVKLNKLRTAKILTILKIIFNVK